MSLKSHFATKRPLRDAEYSFFNRTKEYSSVLKEWSSYA